MTGLLNAFEEQTAPRGALVEYPGAAKLANVVNAFWVALTLDDPAGASVEVLEAMVTQEFARALFTAVFHEEDALEEILHPAFVQRADGEG